MRAFLVAAVVLAAGTAQAAELEPDAGPSSLPPSTPLPTGAEDEDAARAKHAKAQAQGAPGHDAAPSGQAGFDAFLTHWGLSLTLGALPAAGTALLFALPFGLYAAPAFFVVPLVGALIATPIADLMSDKAGGLIGATVGYVMAALPIGLVVGLVGAVPAVDALARGQPLPWDGKSAALTVPAAGVLAGGVLVASTLTTLFGSVGYAAERSARE